jgi:rhodanese-related sulfurtransferase
MGKYSKTAKKTNKTGKWIIAAVLVVVVAAAAAAGAALRESRSSGEPPVVLAANREVDVQEGYDLYQQGVFTLDVRTPEEYQAGHIPGATLIPLDQLAARAGELPVNEPILIYCRSGNRSLQAMNLLGEAGFQELSSMAGGISAWSAAGLPVE